MTLQSRHPSEGHLPTDPAHAHAHAQARDCASGVSYEAFGAIGYEAADPSLQTAHWHEAWQDPTTMRLSR